MLVSISQNLFYSLKIPPLAFLTCLSLRSGFWFFSSQGVPYDEDMLWKDLMQHDNSFMFKYFVYVYYKKLGYVIHSGLKFSCHWLLYERKSETSTHEHAKFAVKIMISTTDEVKSNASTENQHDISWQMILSTNRVVENVAKVTSFICFKRIFIITFTGIYYLLCCCSK
eukprot:TRINITY_DN939_c0_g1_i2.p1 TRINITY_DN939_c0_g1~~TRINITY_DN939_c0_g1_i2.p1  ORF type:complete len:169 (-),score=16.65 TRINITY_DN939_c0_g1_i2:288-794(-)